MENQNLPKEKDIQTLPPIPTLSDFTIGDIIATAPSLEDLRRAQRRFDNTPQIAVLSGLEAANEAQAKKEEILQQRRDLPLSDLKKTFVALLGNGFEINDRNRLVIHDLFYWSIGYAVKDDKDGSFIINPAKGLLLTGNTGSGKTTVLKAVVKFRQWLGLDNIKHATVASIAEAVRDSSEIDTLLKRYKTGNWYFEDLGAENIVKKYGNEFSFGEIVTHRYNQFKQDPKSNVTIFCTNLPTRDDITNIYGDRVRSRVMEMVNVVRLTDNDHREQ